MLSKLAKHDVKKLSQNSCFILLWLQDSTRSVHLNNAKGPVVRVSNTKLLRGSITFKKIILNWLYTDMVQCTDSQTRSVLRIGNSIQKQKQCYPENGTSSLHSTETSVNLYQTTWRQIPEDVTYSSLLYIFSDSYVGECSCRGLRNSDIVHSNKGTLQVVFRFRVRV